MPSELSRFGGGRKILPVQVPGVRESLGLCLQLPPAHRGCTNNPRLVCSFTDLKRLLESSNLLTISSSPAPQHELCCSLHTHPVPAVPVPLSSLPQLLTGTTPHTKRPFLLQVQSKNSVPPGIAMIFSQPQLPTVLHDLHYVFPSFHWNMSKNSLCKSLSTPSVFNCCHQKAP